MIRLTLTVEVVDEDHARTANVALGALAETLRPIAQNVSLAWIADADTERIAALARTPADAERAQAALAAEDAP